MRRGSAVLVVAALLAGACAGGSVGSPTGGDAPTPARPSAAPQAVAPATAAPATGGIVLETTRAADDISLKLTSPVGRGRTAVASAMTAPNAVCTITVTYASGPSRAEGLEAKSTDGAGSVSWSWTVGTNTTPGSWPVEVSCTLVSGQRTVAREMLTVE